MSRKMIFRVDRDLARRLVEARTERGLSSRDVCIHMAEISPTLAISHATLASYERGETSPTIPTLGVLASIYKRPVEWFLGTSESLSGFRYRNLKSRVRIGDQRQFEASASKWIDAYVNLEVRLGQPLIGTVKCPRVDVSTNATDLARNIRELCGLDQDEPVRDTIEILEKLGIRTMELSTQFEIDGMAARRGSSFVVVINPNVSPDRLRLNVLHELAHVLYDDCKNDNNWSDDLVEKRAYEFGSAFLLSDPQLREAFVDRTFVRLMKFKERFGISIAAMIFRAERQNIIPSTTARALWVKMNQKGWRKREPGNVRRDRAIRFEEMLEAAIESKAMSWDELERVTGVYKGDLKDKVNGAIGVPGEGVNEEPEDATLERDEMEMRTSL